MITCPHCRGCICVRGGRLYTFEDAIGLDAIKSIGYGTTKQARMKKTLAQRFGRTPSLADIAWGLMNESLTQPGGPIQQKHIYLEMAKLLSRRGQDPFKILQAMQRAELQNYAREGVLKVQILGGSCEVCSKLDGRVFAVSAAIEQMPIPCRDCDCSPYGGDHPCCLCCYMPEV